MSARQYVRMGITFFVVLLIVVVTLGLSWVTGHQKASLRMASQFVLAAAGLSGMFAIARLWRADPPRA